MSKIWGALVLCGAIMIGPQAAVAQGEDEAEDVAGDALAIGTLIYNGSGCVPGTLRAALIDSDADGFSERLRFDFARYVARLGPGLPISDRRRNCAIRLTLDQPAGWQFGLVSARFVGDARLPKAVVANLQSDIQFSIKDHVTLSSTVSGSYDVVYRRGDALDDPEVVWSRCGVDAPLLGLNTQIFLTGPTTRPASVSSTRQIYRLEWRQCR